MLKLEEFIDKLILRYGEPKSKLIIKEVREHFKNFSISYDQLYYIIIENFEEEYFPNLAKIKKYAKELKIEIPSANIYINPTVEASKSWDVENIIKRYKLIRKGLIETGDIKTEDGDFLHFWDDLYSHYCRLKDQEKSIDIIKKYLEKVKESLLKNEKIPYAGFDEQKINIKNSREKKEVFVGDIVSALF